MDRRPFQSWIRRAERWRRRASRRGRRGRTSVRWASRPRRRSCRFRITGTYRPGSGSGITCTIGRRPRGKSRGSGSCFSRRRSRGCGTGYTPGTGASTSTSSYPCPRHLIASSYLPITHRHISTHARTTSITSTRPTDRRPRPSPPPPDTQAVLRLERCVHRGLQVRVPVA